MGRAFFMVLLLLFLLLQWLAVSGYHSYRIWVAAPVSQPRRGSQGELGVDEWVSGVSVRASSHSQ
jgi:hypothetical protein